MTVQVKGSYPGTVGKVSAHTPVWRAAVSKGNLDKAKGQLVVIVVARVAFNVRLKISLEVLVARGMKNEVSIMGI
jgi:hypothetical protein